MHCLHKEEECVCRSILEIQLLTLSASEGPAYQLKPLRRNMSETTESLTAGNGSGVLKLNPFNQFRKCLLLTRLIRLYVGAFSSTVHGRNTAVMVIVLLLSMSAACFCCVIDCLPLGGRITSPALSHVHLHS